ncbi:MULTISPECIES: glucosamine-6-phosphate deaminase [Clostridium]|uniref:glucosamine-6-phosphate deaminase n=1 Tax=Clostridium TaxID=1485 RepID=UPI000826C5E5|nr:MULTISPECIES: glucosamine-6-phosphate deaminase [Clostridium]PJI09218.1 glucosamine-6-phosphate deaminase [Clostridium sp. CT7]
MKVMVVKDYNEMSIKAARIMASQIILKPNSVLGLATGSSPIGMYKELINLYNKKEIDFRNIKSFNLDEYYGLDETNEQSYHYFMMENLFKHINIPMENINIPNGNAKNMEEECLNYERKIQQSGGIDIQVLGIGTNGHIGFNEPNINFETKTHLVELASKTIKANARFFEDENKVPKKAISMGIKTIMNSKKIILLASGSSKADAIYKAVKGKVTPEVPASILQIHKDVTFVVDKEAASKL